MSDCVQARARKQWSVVNDVECGIGQLHPVQPFKQGPRRREPPILAKRRPLNAYDGKRSKARIRDELPAQDADLDVRPTRRQQHSRCWHGHG